MKIRCETDKHADLPGALAGSEIAHESAMPLSEPPRLSDYNDKDGTDATVTESRELVIVDSSTPNYEFLVNDLIAERGDGRSFEVLILDADQDGIQQITAALAERSDLDAVHIISHGSDGSVFPVELRPDR